MASKKRYVTAGLTIAATAVTAHLMQSGSKSPGVRSQVASSAAIAAPVEPPRSTNIAQNQVTVVGANVVPVARPEPVVAPELVPSGAPELAQNPVIVPRDPQNPEVISGALSGSAGLQTLGASPESAVPNVVAALPVDTPVPTLAPEDAGTDQPVNVAVVPLPPSDVVMPKPLPSVGTELPDRIAHTDTGLGTIAQDEPRNQFGLSCGPILSATVAPNAMVNLMLIAPCRGEERVMIQHGSLEFTGKTDHLGGFRATVPALQSEAEFAIVFDDGEAALTYTDVPDANRLERVALVSHGYTGLQIHALEFGADYGEPGHVWMGAQSSADTADITGGGYHLALGDMSVDDPVTVEVYTYPTDAKEQSGVVRLSVEAEVDALNCEKDVSGFTIEKPRRGQPEPVALSVAMPDCSAIGSFLVLKNLLRDLRIAAN